MDKKLAFGMMRLIDGKSEQAVATALSSRYKREVLDTLVEKINKEN